MSQFRVVASGIDTKPLLRKVLELPKEEWGKHKTWTHSKNPTEFGLPPGEVTVLNRMGMAENYLELRYSQGNPNEANRELWYQLPEARSIVSQLQAALGGIEILGRCIVSRMAPGEVILPHRHLVQFGLPKVYDTFQIPLQSDYGCVFNVDDEEIWMKVGNMYAFDNQKWHSVRNGSKRDRISMMVDIRPILYP